MLFLITFYVYALSMEAYLLTLAIGIFVFGVVLALKYLSFHKEETVKQANEQLKDMLHEEKMAHRMYQKDIENYFLTWIHQIKTPITASKLLLERHEAGTVNRVRQEITEIENYTNLALNYLKLLNHETDMVAKSVTLEAVVKPLIKRYALHFIENQTRIHTDNLHQKVTTDAQWLRIMIEQILNNALKYTKSGDIWIAYDSDQKALSIRDNGIGISKADLPKIFEKGYSGTNGRLNEKSSGIGLFVVKQISKKLQHPIEVNSEQGVSTTFTIYFPVDSNLSKM
ncbi:sensor histidine kinase [Staphylococcus ratti]|uniref:histidine kinase n=1 Tax=Staphylococcus ratti TaxID=2892440 RepID=A0ABY3PFN8_9STAP|nr:sensor histidine kinase [Staphylococcus ratti]UEX91101.1 sensor histidine kinase [Staphylococcus ratti]